MRLRFLHLTLCAAPLLVSPVFAAIDGTVVNGTTGQPQGGVTINLVHPGENGMQSLATVKTGPDGKFSIDQPLPPPPALLQSDYQGVQYNQVVPPGRPTTGLKVNVYDSTSKAADASLTQQHLIVLEPQADGIHATETFLMQNTGKITFSDPAKGSVQFYLPKEGQDKAKVTVEAPNGMPITRAPEKTPQAGVYKVDYPVKPGETVYEVSYALPPSDKFTGRVLGSGGLLLVTPQTVTLTGKDLKDDGIKDLGQGGATAHVYEVTAKSGADYELGVQGVGAINESSASSGTDESQLSEAEGGPPKEHPGAPRLYNRLPWVLGLTFGILALGGALLFKRSAV